ncbi:MAG: cytochrome c3 family protein, partial [Carboxydocellales bacterium]
QIPDNPNMLKDYYYYDHQDPTNPYLPNSSEEQLCETCHYGAIKIDSRVSYVQYQYKKWSTTTGLANDYSLCLRCHNGKGVVDIAAYYNAPSRHSLKAADGSRLNGNIACADCHYTHGSPNLKMLKERLGHNKTQSFQPAGRVWDAATERLFCTRCHNNSTELYGITTNFNFEIPGHEVTSTEFCNKCHGGSPIVAAHGPR